MKNRKYNLFVLILSLIVSLFASCSNGMNIEEPQMAKITFTFEDPFFQNLFGSKNNSRMVSLKTGNNYFSWATIKNSETKEIVTEGMYLNEIPYGIYDITYEIFYFTDEEVSNFEEKYNAALQENKINTNTNFEENEKLQQITNDLFSEYVKNEISIYIGQLDNFLVNHENLTLGISLTKNPKYVPLKQTSDFIYTFFYDSDLVQKDETGNQKVVAKLFKLSEYLAYGAYSENCDLVEILKVDRNTTHVSESDYKYLNEEFEISSEDFKSDKIYQIHLPELAPNNYVLLFEFDLLNSLNPYRVSEVLKIESGLDFNTLYQNNTRYPGFIYLPKYEESFYNEVYSNENSDGIVFSFKKNSNYNYIRLIATATESDCNSFDIWVTNYTEKDEYLINFFYPNINKIYDCSILYYKEMPNTEYDEADFQVYLGQTIAQSSLFENKTTSQAVANYDSDNQQIVITNYESQYLIVNKPEYAISDAHVFSFDVKYKDEYQEVYTSSFEVNEFIYIDSSNEKIIVSVKPEDRNIFETILANNDNCWITCDYQFTLDGQLYSIPLLTDDDRVIIQNSSNNSNEGPVTYVSDTYSNGIVFTAKKIENAARIFAHVYPSDNQSSETVYDIPFNEGVSEVNFYYFYPDTTESYICQYYYYDSDFSRIDYEVCQIKNINPKSQLNSNINPTNVSIITQEDKYKLQLQSIDTSCWTKLCSIIDKGINISLDIKLYEDQNNFKNYEVLFDYVTQNNGELLIDLNNYFYQELTSNKTYSLQIDLVFNENEISYTLPIITETNNLNVTISSTPSSDPLPEVTIEYDNIMTAYKVTYSNPDSTKYPITSLEICGDDCSFKKSSAFTENSATFYYPYDSSSINVTLGYKNNDGDAVINKTYDKPEEATFINDYKELKFNSDESLYSNSRIEVNSSSQSVNIAIFYSNARLAEYTQVSGNLGTFYLVDGTNPYTFDLHLCGSSDYVNYKSFGISEISTTSTIFAVGNDEQLSDLFNEIIEYDYYKVKLYTNYTLKNDDEIDVLNYLNNTCNLTGFECSVNVLESNIFSLN